MGATNRFLAETVVAVGLIITMVALSVLAGASGSTAVAAGPSLSVDITVEEVIASGFDHPVHLTQHACRCPLVLHGCRCTRLVPRHRASCVWQERERAHVLQARRPAGSRSPQRHRACEMPQDKVPQLQPAIRGVNPCLLVWPYCAFSTCTSLRRGLCMLGRIARRTSTVLVNFCECV